jgi:hypothetical protein
VGCNYVYAKDAAKSNYVPLMLTKKIFYRPALFALVAASRATPHYEKLMEGLTAKVAAVFHLGRKHLSN